MTTEIATPASTLTPEQAELQARARAFVEEVLIPLEVQAERARGRLPAERIAEIRHDYQGVSFPLADSAADAAAGRLLGLEVARLADSDVDPKLVHAKASMAKLFVSEAANRCADRAVQIFGGRGYLRTNVAERLWRELRVDRIWEGTSEIQRLIVARALERRGVERVLH
jgi:alkylation response protein AidB-like acyl-CoA dehydrogenase